MHTPTVSWRPKVLNHRSKDFYFFMYIFGWFSHDFSIGKYRYACFDNPASASDNLIGSDFLPIACELYTKTGTVRDPSECADASKVATRCRSDACGSYISFLNTFNFNKQFMVYNKAQLYLVPSQTFVYTFL